MDNKTTCIIIDDEPLAIRLITRHVEQLPELELLKSFQNPIEAFNFVKSNAVDLIFLDIQMPTLTGVEFVKSLNHKPGIIFTTAFRDYAVESYELNVVDYLVKPITFPRLLTAVHKFLGQKKETAVMSPAPESEIKNYFYVNANKKRIKVSYEKIDYIESIKDYIRIHMGEERVITKHTISDFEKKLPDNFLRIHRSFIVNKNKLTAFTLQDVEIGKKEIPIGGSYKKEVLKILEEG